MRRGVLGRGLAAAAWLVAAAAAAPAAADSILVTDAVGRQVEIERPVERFVVSEGRYIPLLALLRPEAPVAGLVGTMTTLGWTQPGLEAQLFARFPEARDIPLFGSKSADSVSAERLIDLAPQVAVFGIGDHGPGADNAELIAQLEAAGTAVLFIDFRLDPLRNTLPSIELIGQVLGAEERAAEYLAFYDARRRAVVAAVAEVSGRPSVFLQVHPGRMECCWAMADGMLGPFVELAGGRNIADGTAPGPTTRHTAEFLLVEDPDVWVGTASGTLGEYRRGDLPVALGPGMTGETAEDSLRRYLSQPEFAHLGAVRSGRAHALWHNFYNSPFNIVVLEALAAWLHPERFPDTDPQATLELIFERFLPFEIDGTYFATLSRD
jgi:iron complex transport system substrate-binding protein